MFVVCCPTSMPNTHVTFSDVFETAKDASDYQQKLLAELNVKSKIIKKWGKRSYLIDLTHNLYVNTRPPHIETNVFTDKEFDIFLQKAYIVEIRGR